ncbi:CAP domain-containing protein [Duganella aquatilis]|uniref:CAP domain-containing protein n=1 Tax=Duganella aquatilis TaxID=2666082 RepID=UPI001E33D260|nr:CAP domain-containing protein [Duganella aquatilis]
MSKLPLLIACLFSAGAAPAAPQADADQLTAMINAYRAAPGLCQGAQPEPAPALTPQPLLAAVRLAPGVILSAALDRAGYANSKADAISVGGAASPQDAMAAMRQPYCRALLNASYTDIGVAHNGNDWTVVLAHAAPPLPSATYPDWRDAGMIILEGVNAARASGRTCGEQSFPPAPPVSWNPQLGATALGHSSDMALRRYFNHTGKDGSNVGDRALGMGYNWSRIGENIAFGAYTPQEAVAGWLASPGHCVNIMNPDFTEMGAAYAVTPDQRDGLTYWTQVFGKPRR